MGTQVLKTTRNVKRNSIYWKILVRINLRIISVDRLLITVFLCLQTLVPLFMAEARGKEVMDLTDLSGWSSEPGGNLSVDTEVKRNNGGPSLLWKWSWWSNHPGTYYLKNPSAKPTPWDPPSHGFGDLTMHYLANSVTYSNPERFVKINKKRSGLSLWIYCGPRPQLAKGLLRLELLAGEKVVATGMYYWWHSWINMKIPYSMAAGAKVTGFRVLAPTHSFPMHSDYAPTCAAIADVELDSGDANYNGVEVENFEAGAIPAGWRAGKNGELQIDNTRFYSGKSSLRWQWKKKDASMVFEKGGAFGGKGKTLGLWVYNERPSNGCVVLEFIKNDKAVFSCWYFLNFKGWHILTAPYDHLGWKAELQPDGMRFSIKDGPDTGRLWFDFVNFDAKGWPPSWYRPQTPCVDNQQPWIDKPGLLATPELCRGSIYDLSVGRPWIPPLKPKGQIVAAQLAFIEKNCPPPPPPPARGKRVFDPKRVAAALEGLSRWGIKYDNGVITGRPIEARFNVPPDAMGAHKDFHRLLFETGIACAAARDCQDNEAKGKLLDALTLMLRHFCDQGCGSQSNNYVPGVYSQWLLPLRGELPQELFDELLAESVFQLGAGGSVFSENPTGNSDVVLGSYSQFPALMCMFSDPSRSLQNTQAFTRTINLIFSRVDADCFGPDGTFFHHGLHHWCYASYEFPVFLRFLKHFHGTCFQLEPQCYDICKKFIFTMAWSFCKYTMPSSMLARPGDSCPGNIAGFAGEMAEIGTADGEPVDRDLASLFMALTDKPDGEQAQKYRGLGIEPYKFDGHRVINGTVTSIHRRDDWMVGIVGMNKNIKGLEIYGGHKNCYSSFARNGSVSVVSSGSPTSCQASGWSFEGWDSRHYPGCTNRICRPQKLWWGRKDIYNDSAFAGGTDLDGDGIWGFALQAEGVDARKSAFCFGRRVTLLTTDVKRTDKGTEPVATTIYQNALAGDPAAEPCFVDGEEIKSFPAELTLEPGKPHWLIDNKGTGYYVHPGSAPLKLLRHKQSWLYLWPEHLRDKTVDPMREIPGKPSLKSQILSMPDAELEKFYIPTTNNFALAYFDHGFKPDAPDCVYTILIRTTPEEMAAFSRALLDKSDVSDKTNGQPPYRIIQRDSQAHILWDRDTNTTGYVIFDSSWKLETGNSRLDKKDSKRGNDLAYFQVSSFKHQVSYHLLSVSRPCMAMVKELDGKLKLSVASTDFKDKTPMVLTLSGSWEIESTDTAQPCKSETRNGSTSVEIRYEFEKPMMGCMPIRMTIKPKGGR